ncbi:hypothetical protein KAI78_08700 [bacterium]|nr:hypothetical protein [bacterium]
MAIELFKNQQISCHDHGYVRKNVEKSEYHLHKTFGNRKDQWVKIYPFRKEKLEFPKNIDLEERKLIKKKLDKEIEQNPEKIQKIFEKLYDQVKQLKSSMSDESLIKFANELATELGLSKAMSVFKKSLKKYIEFSTTHQDRNRTYYISQKISALDPKITVGEGKIVYYKSTKYNGRRSKGKTY